MDVEPIAAALVALDYDNYDSHSDPACVVAVASLVFDYDSYSEQASAVAVDVEPIAVASLVFDYDSYLEQACVVAVGAEPFAAASVVVRKAASFWMFVLAPVFYFQNPYLLLIVNDKALMVQEA